MDRDSYDANLASLKRQFNAGQNQNLVQGRPTQATVTSPGRTITLKTSLQGTGADPISETIEAMADDPLLNEWCIYIAPSPSTLASLALGEEWGVTVRVENNHDSAQFTTYRPGNSNVTRYPVPIVGVAIPVHGQRIRVGLFRMTDVDSDPVKVVVAIIPRLPGLGVITVASNSEAGLNTNVAIPTMARGIRVFVGLSAGDSISYIGANGSNILGTVNLVDADLLSAIPVHPDAAFIRYNTSVVAPGKFLIYQFETWT